jgi:hypothetical protein
VWHDGSCHAFLHCSLSFICHVSRCGCTDTCIPHYYAPTELSSCLKITQRVGVSSRMKGYYQFHIVTNNYTSNAHAFAMINKESPKFFTLNDGFQNPRVGARLTGRSCLGGGDVRAHRVLTPLLGVGMNPYLGGGEAAGAFLNRKGGWG